MIPVNPIPALSFKQPWAELILAGEKSVENRTWSTAYRGRIWVHASKSIALGFESSPDVHELFRGGFVGSVELDGVVLYTPERWIKWRERHRDLSTYRPGTYAWLLRNPRRIRVPINASGAQKLFTPDPQIQKALNGQVFC